MVKKIRKGARMGRHRRGEEEGGGGEGGGAAEEEDEEEEERWGFWSATTRARGH